MTESEPPEFHFGLPDEPQDVLMSDIDDWDDWQLEGLITEAMYAADERAADAKPDPRAAETTMLSALMAMAGEEEPWGIDEPLTAADFAFLDEDDWPET